MSGVDALAHDEPRNPTSTSEVQDPRRRPVEPRGSINEGRSMGYVLVQRGRSNGADLLSITESVP